MPSAIIAAFSFAASGVPGLTAAKVRADAGLQRVADGLRLCRVAARAFLDHALDRGDGECHAGGLDALQIDRGEQPRAAAARPRGFDVQFGQFAEFVPSRVHGFAVQQGGNSRRHFRHVECTTGAQDDRCRPLAQIDATDECRLAPVPWQEVMHSRDPQIGGSWLCSKRPPEGAP